jgi:hypothetical protein
MRLKIVLAAIALVASACGDDSPSSPSRNATLNVRLTDSPFSDAQALLVTFSEVSAHRSEASWTRLPFANGATSRTCDLKKLQGADDVLGAGALEAGHYTMLRLVVSSATLHFDNPSTGPACAAAMTAPAGRSATVEVPSGEVRLNRQFDLTTSGATTILLDFDGDRSVRETGNGRFMLSPVISIVSVQ